MNGVNEKTTKQLMKRYEYMRGRGRWPPPPPPLPVPLPLPLTLLLRLPPPLQLPNSLQLPPLVPELDLDRFARFVSALKQEERVDFRTVNHAPGYEAHSRLPPIPMMKAPVQFVSN